MRKPVWQDNPTGRFSDRAADYVRYRPSYPTGAIDAILAGLGEPGSLLVADMGAGTGISSRLMAERGARVIAVEPNAEMRSAAADHDRVEWRDGTAERSGLAARSVDLVVCAQAFHWFDPTGALTEFLRILRPGGRLAVLWNIRDRSDAFTAEYTRLVTQAAGQTPHEERSESKEALLADDRFANRRTERFAYEQLLPLDGAIGRARSASYVPREGAAWEMLVGGLTAAAARYADQDGRVHLRYETLLYMGERPGA